MQPVKLGGLTLKSEEIIKTTGPIHLGEVIKEAVDATSEEPTGPTPDFNIQEALTSIIKRVEEFPKDDNTIKAIGKLKGALILLS